jgi:hypothetical protein
MNTLLRPLAPAALALLVAACPAMAGPGAHGPNGEHLDAPATLQAGPALPRVEARTDAFELVAELRASELVIMVDRYETNEPVLGARLEAESGGVKAVAAFRAEQGDYAVTDAALLKALAAAGEHGMVFTLVAGAESDLLDGTLVTAAAPAASGHGHGHEAVRAAWIGAGIAALGLLGGLAWSRQRRSRLGHTAGAL